MESQAIALPPIDEEDDDEEEEAHCDLEAIEDPDHLKNLRTGGKSVHTKSGKKMMKAVRIGSDRDEVRALRAVYVRDFEELERRHDRYVCASLATFSSNDLEGQRQWIQAVIYDQQKLLAACDKYLNLTKPQSSASVATRASSRHSSVSSSQAKILEAERKEQEARLKLQQAEDEAKRQAEEDESLRELQVRQRQIDADREQRKLKDEMELQQLTGSIMRQQLADITGADGAANETRAMSTSSAPSGSVRRRTLLPSIFNQPAPLNQPPPAENVQTTNTADHAPVAPATTFYRTMATPAGRPAALSTPSIGFPYETFSLDFELIANNSSRGARLKNNSSFHAAITSK
ncbi:hypothetical protein DAPPUDRAFT_325221 [Daphnia pulex]|uniref:Uncharacterized protein n=1 Tax=Daphnia pulex TaxID=6669 RepID=E9H427_DAPPU|nr:hypothetical protein DAPPUDRAFT_325221 [Daphnia pulex]|eukprot:EFX73510.1 hypothetical protein DAPPUDRAFT_325221 [Daphnia pulex]